MEPKEDEFEIIKRSEAGQIVDALGDTALFAYRVVSFERTDGTSIIYRGAYNVDNKSGIDISFIEKCTGYAPNKIITRSLRWETVERSKSQLMSAARFGFKIVDEGTFVFHRDITAAELSEHMGTLETWQQNH